MTDALMELSKLVSVLGEVLRAQDELVRRPLKVFGLGYDIPEEAAQTLQDTPMIRCILMEGSNVILIIAFY